jgi:glycosyltransferase involved in cell wall biosynthesis
METPARMKPDPTVVLGMPAYNRPDALPRTLESLLSQTYRDFALVVVHDGPSPETAAVVDTYAREYPRITYEEHATRLGMVGNWRLVFERARQLYPQARYFAWVSDHDLWHPRWLQELAGVLDDHPEVVLAYAQNLRMMPDTARMTDKVFETFGVTSRAARLGLSARYQLSGDMIYGLVRADALESAGVFRRVVTPDRQVLLALSLFGQVRQVPEVLWYREVLRVFDIERQRKVFFPDGAPLYIYLNSHLQHCATLLWDFAVLGKGRPEFGRIAAAGFAGIQLWSSFVRDVMAMGKGVRMALEHHPLGRRLVSLLPSGADIRAARRRASAQGDVTKA